GFSRELNSFVQYYGSKELDASLLLLPLVGFLPPEDHRIQGTVAAIEKNLMQDGLVARYDTRSSVDGLVVVREGPELHRHDVPAHHEGGAETRPETKEEHRSTLVAPKGLHRGIVDDLHGPTKRHFEIEPDPAMAKIAGFSESTIRTLRVVFIRIPAPLCHTGGTVDTVTFNSCRVRSSALKIS